MNDSGVGRKPALGLFPDRPTPRLCDRVVEVLRRFSLRSPRLGDRSSEPLTVAGINPAGQTTGYYFDAGGSSTAFCGALNPTSRQGGRSVSR